MKWTVNKAALEFGTDRRTLTKKLAGIGVSAARGRTYTTREICRALFGDHELEKTLETRERRIALQMDNAERLENLFPKAEVIELYTKYFPPIREKLFAMPRECAARVRPDNPQLAESVLFGWIDEVLPLLRAQFAALIKEHPNTTAAEWLQKSAHEQQTTRRAAENL